MNRKEICKALIEKGVKARVCFFNGIPERKWKDKAPMCNGFIHGVRYASMAAGVLNDEEAVRVEDAIDSKLTNEENLSFEKTDMIQLPPDDEISTCSYKQHLKKAFLVRSLSLLVGIVFGFGIPLVFLQ